MEKREVSISKKATLSVYQTIDWYQKNRGYSFAKTYEENINETIIAIAKMPTIGRMEKR
ncbi:MAG: hypothetical protein IJP70_07955 [Bacteroidales bacterium]|nr:hypothetical protein [Bacteroidales bacterium]